MAKADKKKVSKIKVKKKLWYKIIAPKLFGQKEVGEAYLASPENALGRLMKINLKDLTGNVKDQTAYIGFKINKVDGNVLRTAVVGYELTPTYVKKSVRKNTDKLDDHFRFKTKDGKDVVLKSLTITFHKSQRSVKNQIRKELKSLLEKEVKESDFAAFVGDLVNRRVQMTVKKKLHKIFPVKEVSVKSLKLKDEKVEREVPPTTPPPTAKEEVKEKPKVEEKPTEPSPNHPPLEETKEEKTEVEEVKEKVEEKVSEESKKEE